MAVRRELLECRTGARVLVVHPAKGAVKTVALLQNSRRRCHQISRLGLAIDAFTRESLSRLGFAELETLRYHQPAA
ncbi:MAG: hypothetical protein ACRD0K_24400 [Egibacteraceae bacterium]